MFPVNFSAPMLDDQLLIDQKILMNDQIQKQNKIAIKYPFSQCIGLEADLLCILKSKIPTIPPIMTSGASPRGAMKPRTGMKKIIDPIKFPNVEYF
jgi:hypothetical protein